MSNLDLLAALSDDPVIRALVARAKLVKVEKDAYCVRVWTQKNVWEVRKSLTGGLYCTCPAYRFNKDDPRTCKHITAVCALLREDEIPAFVPMKQRNGTDFQEDER